MPNARPLARTRRALSAHRPRPGARAVRLAAGSGRGSQQPPTARKWMPGASARAPPPPAIEAGPCWRPVSFVMGVARAHGRSRTRSTRPRRPPLMALASRASGSAFPKRPHAAYFRRSTARAPGIAARGCSSHTLLARPLTSQSRRPRWWLAWRLAAGGTAIRPHPAAPYPPSFTGGPMLAAGFGGS